MFYTSVLKSRNASVTGIYDNAVGLRNIIL
jgi:hypothetical protein